MIIELNRLNQFIGRKRKNQFILVIFLTIITSFAEIVSIGAVIPFLSIMLDPESFLKNPIIKPLLNIININDKQTFILIFTILFIFASLIACILRLSILWASTKLSFATGADLSIDIYERTLYQPYTIHIARNSSEIISAISNKTNGIIYGIIIPFINIISSGIVLLIIITSLLIINPIVLLTSIFGFGLIYIMVYYTNRAKLISNGVIVAKETSSVIKNLQEGLNGIRDILIDNNQKLYIQIYKKSDLNLRKAQASNLFISSSPRYVMEALGIVIISLIAYYLTEYDSGFIHAIPLLGVIALGAQRLLPLIQQLYNSWSTIQGNKATLEDILYLLEQPSTNYTYFEKNINLISFDKEIKLKNISYYYNQSEQFALKNITLVIKKGSRVGFIGHTGCGKSTLIDIVMGLLEPQEGVLEIDGQYIGSENLSSWQKHIAHVPQTIFIADKSIEENIALGVAKDKIDHERVKMAARQAQIAELIETWPQEYQTTVGERGVRLSGGQRQRIGIARALYKKADLLIFDEATSALDTETEKSVMQAINGLSRELTILIIAHRISTLKDCTEIIELKDGKIKHINFYKL